MSAMARPNVLLVVLDTARADHFGPWGGRARTPAFDAFAAKGTVIPDARAAAPWTVPSHASMFSGLPPFMHGVTGGAARGSEGGLASLAPVIATHRDRWLPEVMRRSGYRTFAISANVWVTRQMGFDLGFDAFHPIGVANVAPRGGPPTRPQGAKGLIPAAARERLKGPARHLADARTGRDFGLRVAQSYLRREAWRGEDDVPFFGFVNIMECHAPYVPPGAFNTLKGAARLRAPGYARRFLLDAHATAYNLGAAEVPENALAAFRSLYAAEVAYADTFVGGMVRHLAAEGLTGNTLVMVTSDHGENLGEDHLLGHQLSLDTRLLHVPLAISGPGAPTEPEAAAWSTAGIPRLIADAAGVDGPWEPPGAIAVSQYEGGRRQIRHAARAESRYHLSDSQRARLDAEMELATDGTATLLRDHLGEHRAGPAESMAALSEALDAARGAGPPDSGSGYRPEEEAEIEAHLEQLGYL
jgi:arylsulfatase A-like enzyme